MVPKGCQFTIPWGLIGTPLKVQVYYSGHIIVGILCIIIIPKKEIAPAILFCRDGMFRPSILRKSGRVWNLRVNDGISSWWFQPLWKILVKMEIFPKGVKIKRNESTSQFYFSYWICNHPWKVSFCIKLLIFSRLRKEMISHQNKPLYTRYL